MNNNQPNNHNCAFKLLYWKAHDYVNQYFAQDQLTEQNIEEVQCQSDQQYQKWSRIWGETKGNAEEQKFINSLKQSVSDELRIAYILDLIGYQCHLLSPIFLFIIADNILAVQNHHQQKLNCTSSIVGLIACRIIKLITHLHSQNKLKQCGQIMYRSASRAIIQKSLRYSILCNKQFTISEISKMMMLDCQKLLLLPYRLSTVYLNIETLVFISVLIIYLSGWAGLIGIFSLFAFISVRLCLKQKLNQYQQAVSIKTSERIKNTIQIFSIIKFIKVNALQLCYFQKLKELRSQQMAVLLSKYCFQLIPQAVVMSSVRLVIMIIAIVLIFTHQRFDTAVFFSITLAFHYANIGIATNFMTLIKDTLISMQKIQTFLLSNQMDANYLDNPTNNSQNIAIKVTKGNFYWGTKDQQQQKQKLHLHDINFQIQKGQFAALIGKYGSGKTTLLNSLFGQMKKQPNSNITINGTIAYVSQNAWIMNDSVKDNITFGQPYNQQRYIDAIHYSCLKPDLQIFSQGDQTIIGEKGCTLSGGQKIRISLARALYAQSDIYILDDVLSAVDAHVGSFIFSETLRKHLRGKTILLVTHSLQYLEYTNKIIIIEEGRIVQQGSYADLSNHSHIKQIKSIKLQNKHSEQQKLALPEQQKLQASLQCRSYQGQQCFRYYIKRNGGTWFFVVSIIYMVAVAALGSFSYIWMYGWANSTDPSQPMYIYINLAIITAISLVTNCISLILQKSQIFHSLHSDMIKGLLFSPLQYFEQTSLAKIINRLSNDLYNNDRIIITEYLYFITTFGFSINYLLSIIYIYTINKQPIRIVVAVVYFGCMGYFYYRYFITCRTLHQLQQSSRIPINSCFSEIVNGLTTIRAYQAQSHMKLKINWYLLNHNKISIANAIVNSWAKFIITIFSLLYVTYALVIPSNQQHNYYYDVFILFNALSVQDFVQKLNTSTLQFLVRLKSLGNCEELAELPAEEGYKELVANWNQTQNCSEQKNETITDGAITFANFSAKYKPQLECVLKDINISIKGGEKIGIVGRTGSGKSSLMLCLLRVIESNSGRIQIDRHNISQLNLLNLRSCMNIILQQHFLFTGTVRDNIDPSHEYSDSKIKQALILSELWEYFQNKQGLDTMISQGGDNLSAGQKQLLNITRSLLNPKKIVLVDEATASIDFKSDQKIQKIMQKQFANCTVLTIAHRINTVIKCDRIIVLDNGCVKQFDSPQTLLSNKKSWFWQLYNMSGQID